MGPDFKDFGYAEDTYLDKNRCIQRLIDDYHKYGYIIIAYDFDNTVCPEDDQNGCNQVIELLQECSKFDIFKMICYTCRTEYDRNFIVRPYLDSHKIRYDKINEDVVDFTDSTSKVYFNIFLDDRAGLRAAYEDLTGFLKWYCEEGGDN